MSGDRRGGGTPPDGLVRISTHVLDTARGTPAADVPVRLDRRDSGGWTPVAQGRTDADGRLADWTPLLDRVPLRGGQAGGYRLVFQVDRLYPPGEAFFPEIVVAFQITEPDRHHHVPLLLSPYGYTTYRGS
ncbi:hydroxyisourate hydrolase [Plantactinospora sp. WMMB782]|uniref:hydroxyisourate hydrolase n=1 Tax=Plantactinospora sp. WMMB782 TaxID=3404121 RepID=UPI003B9591D5